MQPSCEALALRLQTLMTPKTIDLGGGRTRTQVQGGPLVVYVVRRPAPSHSQPLELRACLSSTAFRPASPT